jgi:flagellar assembly protein FliH
LTEPKRENFICGALNQDDDCLPTADDVQDSDQVQSLIQDAFKKGMDQGRAETIAAQQESVDKTTGALKAAMEEMARLRRQDVDRMETETVRLALAIAKKIIRNESEHGAAIGRVVKMAMQKVADPRHSTLRLNPKDIDTVKLFQSELLLEEEINSAFRIEADDTIQQGGCIIETKLGDVDARIDQQIKIIEERLTAELPKYSAEGCD